MFIVESLSLPPEPLLRSYLNLLYRVLVDLRSSARFGDRQAEYVHDLADAVHNLPALIGFFAEGSYNDERLRRAFLQPFDRKWASQPLAPLELEATLDEFTSSYAVYQRSPGAGNQP